jgi:hypothetical protein
MELDKDGDQQNAGALASSFLRIQPGICARVVCHS